MKQSAKAKRLARHHKRFKSAPKLNLVSLMDIFTILVFFLIINQSEVTALPSNKEISLPISIAEELPAENLMVTILAKTVLIQGRLVYEQDTPLTLLDKTSAQALNKPLIEAIKKELTYLSNKRPVLTKSELEKGRAITIIGNSSVPYQILKQIMAACADSDYRNMSLAVKQLAKKAKSKDS